ncbi:MAG: N-methyl-D-aspartate receptor NMDAR2C subunit [Burkholderiaceae bacterium]
MPAETAANAVCFTVEGEEPSFDAHWAPSIRAIGAEAEGREFFDVVVEAYREPQRRRHGLGLVAEGLAWLEAWREEAGNVHELALAIWLKDVVLDPRRHDNEGRSGRLALEGLGRVGVPLPAARRIRDLIVATRPDARPFTQDARLLVDIDLAILGAPAKDYQAHERALREEMAFISDFVWRRRRIESVKGMLARSRIFHTDVVHKALDARARENLAATLERLLGD